MIRSDRSKPSCCAAIRTAIGQPPAPLGDETLTLESLGYTASMAALYRTTGL